MLGPHRHSSLELKGQLLFQVKTNEDLPGSQPGKQTLCLLLLGNVVGKTPCFQLVNYFSNNNTNSKC